jgi:hypothetical protein
MARPREHGMIGTPTYKSWDCMKQRCLNPKNKKFPTYGAIGITVCERWLRFEAFLEDMGEAPSGTTIDRFDGTLGYFKGNCRWATSEEQVLNRKSIHWVVYQGAVKPLAHWCDELEIERGSAYQRLKKGLSVAEILGFLPASKKDAPKEIDRFVAIWPGAIHLRNVVLTETEYMTLRSIADRMKLAHTEKEATC